MLFRSPIEKRDDVGQLWENFCFIERRKYLQKSGRVVKPFYWRNLEQREIDLVEQEGQDLRVYEMKYSSNKLPNIPVAFIRSYPNYSSYELVNQDSFINTILK